MPIVIGSMTEQCFDVFQTREPSMWFTVLDADANSYPADCAFNIAKILIHLQDSIFITLRYDLIRFMR